MWRVFAGASAAVLGMFGVLVEVPPPSTLGLAHCVDGEIDLSTGQPGTCAGHGGVASVSNHTRVPEPAGSGAWPIPRSAIVGIVVAAGAVVAWSSARLEDRARRRRLR